MTYKLLNRFRELFEGVPYKHRVSGLGDSVALCLPDDLYALDRSAKLKERIDAKLRVVTAQNKLHGIKARRGDGTFGEIIPRAVTVDLPGFVVAHGPLATVEIGTEVKILAKAMIKQIGRVMNDLQNQKREFETAGGNPITVGVIGINQSPHYVSFEGDREWPTDGRKHKHPIQEAAEAERRLAQHVSGDFDEFLILRFRATNVAPYPFEWVDQKQTETDYGAALVRILRKYEVRF